MSEENVEVVRAVFEAFARGDYEAALGGLDEEIQFDGSAGHGMGHEGTRRGMARFMGTWDDYSYEIRDIIDCGDEVLVEGWQRGRGKRSGIEIAESIYAVCTVRGGRMTRYQLFRDRQQALEAVGLSE